MGWSDPGYQGSDYHLTPRIDALAREGMVFTAAYANAPNCAPSRACILSGQYPPRHGIYTVGSPARGQKDKRRLIPIPNRRTLPSEVVTLAETLQSAGYRTAHVGKWHLGPDPRTQGFDLNVGGNQAGHPKRYVSPYANPDLKDGPAGEYLTDRLTQEATRFIDACEDQPFFLHLAHYAVHTPIQPKPADAEAYRDRAKGTRHQNLDYAAMVTGVDRSLGVLLDHLEARKLSRRTVVVFFSDNGGVARITSNAPLRGGKGMLYEGGLREPLIVRWPGHTKPGTRCDIPVIGTDFYPTFARIAQAALPTEQPLDGVDLVSLLEGEPSEAIEARTLFWHFPAYLEAGRGRFRTTPAAALRQGRWKLIEYFEDGRLELFDLDHDLGETQDLAAEQPERVKTLHEEMRRWRKDIKAPVPTEKNPDYRP
ncbi:MAG: sulfatase [Planctomycetes bacterium]|nr:sulfatase [Planctomycetota bacterium]